MKWNRIIVGGLLIGWTLWSGDISPEFGDAASNASVVFIAGMLLVALAK